MNQITCLLLCTVSAAGVALAQQPAPRAPVAGAAAGAAAAAATNSTQLYLELREIQAKIHPIEENLVETDPEIKANLARRREAQQQIQDLDKKRRELTDTKLAARPDAAALLKRRGEVVRKLEELRQAGAGPAVGPNAEILNRLNVPNPTQVPATK